MKYIIATGLMTSYLLAGITQTNEGDLLDIYSQHNAQSEIIAQVHIDKGKLEQLRCRNTRDDTQWCKIIYHYNGISINGWSDKKSLDSINSRPNTKAMFDKSYGGRYNDEANAILPLHDGLLLVGNTQSFGEGQNDVYVIKVDNFGNKVWSRVYGGGGDDIAYSVVEINGGFMISGKTSSFGNRDQSVYVSRISKDGKLLWQNGYYSDKDDYYLGKSIIKVNEENVLIAGSEDHMKFFDSEVNCYLTSVDINGKQKWLQLYGGSDIDRANSIIKVKDGYVYAGETESWGKGAKDMYVAKINDSGKRVWHNAFGYRYEEIANQIIATKDGGYIAVGSTNSDTRNLKDIYVVKINPDGTRAWQHHYGSKENEEGFGIVEVDDGYVIAGYTNDTKSYNSDVYLLKIDKIGNIFWSKKYGGSKDERANAIVKLKDGFAVAGYTMSTIKSDKDLYLLKVDLNGNLN